MHSSGASFCVAAAAAAAAEGQQMQLVRQRQVSCRLFANQKVVSGAAVC